MWLCDIPAEKDSFEWTHKILNISLKKMSNRFEPDDFRVK